MLHFGPMVLSLYPQFARQLQTSEDHNIARQAKHQSIVHVERTCRTFLLDRELSDWAEGGNLPSWSKKQRAFLLQTYP